MWLSEVEKQLQAVQERVEKATELHKLKDLQEYLKASKENISFVAGQGHRKSEEQRKWETFFLDLAALERIFLRFFSLFCLL